VVAALLACGLLALPLAAPGSALALRAQSVVTMSSLELGVVRVINAIRVGDGLTALELSPALARAADAHSRQQLVDGYFGHKTASGTPFAERIAYYYPPRGSAFYAAGENLLWGSPSLSAVEVVGAWMRSAPHRANILAPAWREIGVAALRISAPSGVYRDLPATLVTADFGVRVGSGSIPDRTPSAPDGSSPKGSRFLLAASSSPWLPSVPEEH
jgi:uncharacterized protein YkwD